MELTFAGDESTVGAVGSTERRAWETGFVEALALFLGISPWRIIVLSVRIGSLIVNVAILDPAPQEGKSNSSGGGLLVEAPSALSLVAGLQSQIANSSAPSVQIGGLNATQAAIVHSPPVPPPYAPPHIPPSLPPPHTPPPLSPLPCPRDVAAAVCTDSRAELCYFDVSCGDCSSDAWGCLGCNAGRQGMNCRFCGFGHFRDIPCPGTALGADNSKLTEGGSDSAALLPALAVVALALGCVALRFRARRRQRRQKSAAERSSTTAGMAQSARTAAIEDASAEDQDTTVHLAGVALASSLTHRAQVSFRPESGSPSAQPKRPRAKQPDATMGGFTSRGKLLERLSAMPATFRLSTRRSMLPRSSRQSAVANRRSHLGDLDEVHDEAPGRRAFGGTDGHMSVRTAAAAQALTARRLGVISDRAHGRHGSVEGPPRVGASIGVSNSGTRRHRSIGAPPRHRLSRGGGAESSGGDDVQPARLPPPSRMSLGKEPPAGMLTRESHQIAVDSNSDPTPAPLPAPPLAASLTGELQLDALVAADGGVLDEPQLDALVATDGDDLLEEPQLDILVDAVNEEPSASGDRAEIDAEPSFEVGASTLSVDSFSSEPTIAHTTTLAPAPAPALAPSLAPAMPIRESNCFVAWDEAVSLDIEDDGDGAEEVEAEPAYDADGAEEGEAESAFLMSAEEAIAQESKTAMKTAFPLHPQFEQDATSWQLPPLAASDAGSAGDQASRRAAHVLQESKAEDETKRSVVRI